MRPLLDTQALLYHLLDDPRLPDEAIEAIEGSGQPPFVSVASIWEVAIKAALGKLEIGEDFYDVVRSDSYELEPIRPEHAWAVRELPLHHRDPFDRLLIARALADGLSVVTGDPAFALYGVATIWD